MKATTSLTITITKIPVDLIELLWNESMKTAIKKRGTTIQPSDNISFTYDDICAQNREWAMNLFAAAMTMRCIQSEQKI